MIKTINIILNFIIVAGLCSVINSCASITPYTKNLPPIKIIGKIKGKPVELTIYPDGSKPTEVVFVGQDPATPIEIEIN